MERCDRLSQMEIEDEFIEIMGVCTIDDSEMQYMWEEFCDECETNGVGIQGSGEELVQIRV